MDPALFADGTKTSGTIAAAYPKIDIATLIPRKLPEVVIPATLGGGVAVGSDVVAIGNPLGLRDSTTTGVVSGLNRKTETKAGALSGLIQVRRRRQPGQLRRSASECPRDRRRRCRVDCRPRK
jgi:putative serine protease PepD